MNIIKNTGVFTFPAFGSSAIGFSRHHNLRTLSRAHGYMRSGEKPERTSFCIRVG